MDTPSRLSPLRLDILETPLSISELPSTSETEMRSLDEQRRISELKYKLKQYLKEHPRNFSGAAKFVNLDRQTVVRLSAEFERELEDEYLDDIEEKIVRIIRNLPLDSPEAEKKFNFNESLKVLERLRPERWSNKRPSGKKKLGGGGMSPREAINMLRDENK